MRSRGRRPWLAGIFALLILLVNVFPVVVLAQPYVPSLGGGTYQAPQLQAPDLQAPQRETPQLEAPRWEVPDLEPPPGSPPVLQTPQGDTPHLQPPAGSLPGLQAPSGTVPAWESPGGRVPALQPPGGSVPGLQAPDGSAPSPTPGAGVPGLQPPGSNPPSLNPNGGSPGSEPFGETLAYKMLELSFKDVIGGTLSYSAGLLEGGTVTAGQGGAGYASFLFQLGLKGLDIGLQDTPYGNLTGLALDGLGAKGAYDSYKFIVQRNTTSMLGGISAQRSISNSVQGVTGAAGAVRVPGIVTGLNVGVAAISLPFDMYNTVSQFRQAYDSRLGEDKQNEKFVDGIGSLGSTFMDAGIIASVIPGGQPIAVALVVTGGVLWAGSRLVKWSNKASGGALSKGISSVRKGIGKAIGWMKSIFS